MQRRRLLSLALIPALAACGGGGDSADVVAVPQITPEPVPQEAPTIQKRGVFVQDGKESALFVHGGEVLVISFARGWGSKAGESIEIRRWSDASLLAEHPWTGAMGCVLVDAGVIHIFGNTDWTNRDNTVIHSTLDPVTFAPSAPSVILTMNAPADPFRIYNTSVCKDANGWRMAVETEKGTYFADSPDGNAWRYHGGQLAPGQYVGCPSLHYIDGTHYTTRLVDLGEGKAPRWVTQVAKSADNCFTFTYGGTLLAPDAAEGINASDVDMIEHAGSVYGVYLDGDQATGANLRTFTYAGTLGQLLAPLA